MTIAKYTIRHNGIDIALGERSSIAKGLAAKGLIDGSYLESDELRCETEGKVECYKLLNLTLFRVVGKKTEFSLNEIRRQLKLYCADPSKKSVLTPYDRIEDKHSGSLQLRYYALFCVYDAFISTRNESYDFAKLLRSRLVDCGLRDVFIADDRLGSTGDWDAKITAAIDVSRCLVALYYAAKDSVVRDPDSKGCRVERDYAQEVAKQVLSVAVNFDPDFVSNRVYGTSVKQIKAYSPDLSDISWKEFANEILNTSAFTPTIPAKLWQRIKNSTRDLKVFFVRIWQGSPVLLVGIIILLWSIFGAIATLTGLVEKLIPSRDPIQNTMFISSIGGLEIVAGNAKSNVGESNTSLVRQSLFTGVMEPEQIWPQLQERCSENKRIRLSGTGKLQADFERRFNIPVKSDPAIGYVARFPDFTSQNTSQMATILESIVRSLSSSFAPLEKASRKDDWVIFHCQERSTLAIVAQPRSQKLRFELIDQNGESPIQGILASVSPGLRADIPSKSIIFFSGLPIVEPTASPKVIPSTVEFTDDYFVNSLVLPSFDDPRIELFRTNIKKFQVEREEHKRNTEQDAKIGRPKAGKEQDAIVAKQFEAHWQGKSDKNGWFERVRQLKSELESRNSALKFYVLPEIQ